MNAGNPDITAEGLVSTPSTMIVVDGLSPGDVHLPDGEMALRATFTREGPDLLIEGRGGEQVLVQDYFASEEPRDLILGDGSGVLKGSLVTALAGSATPGQYAQLETASLTEGAVGQVEALTGEAFAVRVDGTRVALEVGSPIYMGDVLETTFDGAIAVLFVDGTTFSLAEDARMVVDELIYDAGSEGNTASFSLVQGLFVLVSGDVAKTGEMMIETPVSTIGIRGTSAAIQSAADGLENIVTLLQDPDGNVGLIEVATAVATVILSEIGATTTVASLDQAPSAVEILQGADIEALYRAALATMQILSDADLGVTDDADGSDDGSDEVAEADPDAAVEAFAEAVADLFDALAEAIEVAEAEIEAAGETETDEGTETTGLSAGETLESLPEKDRNIESSGETGGSGGPTNNVPVGDILLAGLVVEDSVLTADVSGISDADGLGDFSYQWQALTDTGWADIDGATDQSFTPGDDQVGLPVRVVVSYTDGGGTLESIASEPSDPIANVDDPPEGNVLVTGVAQEDVPLTADTSGLSDADGLGAFSYQWQVQTGAGWTDIAGATDDTFTPGDDEVDAQVRVVVSYTDGGGNPESVASDAAGPIANVNDELEGTAVVVGLAQENALLTADTSGLSDADGLGAFSYQWQALGDAGWTDIAGATDQTFTPDDAQVGSQVRVIVSYTDGEGTPETTTSAATDAIANVDDAPEGNVTVTGVAQEDAPLTADTSNLSDADGLGAFSYQWQALTDTGWSDIAGATDDTFTPGDDEVGSQVRVVVSYTDGGGNAESVESDPTAVIGNVNDEPAGDVIVDGTAEEDSELTANTDGLSDDDGLGEFGYQWQALVDGTWSDVAGATDQAFTPGDDQVGQQVRVVVSYTDGEGTDESVESDPTAVIGNVNDEPAGAVTIDGAAEEDSGLTANTDGLSDADGLGEFGYQWQALVGGAWTDVAGATDQTFTPGDDLVGQQVRVVVSYTDGEGTDESVESDPTAVIANVNDEPAGAVTIDGAAEEDSELTANTDGLSDNDGLGAFSYQWQALVNGAWVAVAGATDQTFTPGDDQVGQQLRVIVSYTDGEGTEESVESAATDNVNNVNDAPDGDVTVSGDAEENSVLTADTSDLSDVDGLGEFSYQWQILTATGWVDIASATLASFTPGEDEVGSQVRVVVSYTDGQGTEESIVSDPTPEIDDEPGEIDVVVSDDGEVFIQGTFVELGVSANGTLGTTGAAPDTFEAAGQPGNPGLSFYASDEPLAEGNNGTGDAFIPGLPVENFTLAFTDSSGSFVGSNENAGLGTDIPMTVESTSSNDGVGTATLTGDVDDKVEVSQTISLGADDTYYTTSVTITNTGDETLTGLRYMRNNDPDQEVDQTGVFTTSNDVLLNPNGSNGIAAVNADGLSTGQSILLVADQNALNNDNGLDDGAIQVRASAYGFENLNPFNPNGFDNPADPNGARADIGINLVYVLPDLAPGESVTITWVTSTNTASDGNDYLVARADETLVDGGNGDDIIFAARENTAETLVGGNGADALFASSAGAIGDILSGGNGQDVLSSGGGADNLTGGLGADRFFYDDVEDGQVIAANTTYSEIAAPETDVIVDFDSGLDVIQLLSSAFGDMAAGELVEGVSFSVIAESYDGTNAGTNANHDAGVGTFIYSTADGTLHYDGNGADAGYTAVAQVDQPSASDVEIVATA